MTYIVEASSRLHPLQVLVDQWRRFRSFPKLTLIAKVVFVEGRALYCSSDLFRRDEGCCGGIVNNRAVTIDRRLLRQ